jgi:hypothetical protein
MKDLLPVPMHLRRLVTRSLKRWRIIFRIPSLIILSLKQVICPAKDDIRNYCGFFLFEMLASQSAESHPWRFAFQKALRAMNRGQTEELLKPMPVRKTGAPFELGEWKLEALLQIFYRVGKGVKKYRALQLVSEAIGQSADTIRDWEKDTKFDEDYSNELQCAELARSIRDAVWSSGSVWAG